MANTYLTKAANANANQRLFTYSLWVKASSTTGGNLITFRESSTRYLRTFFENGKLCLKQAYDGSTEADTKTTALYRDPSAWMHIVIAVDTAQGTSTNRVKMYVNGEQITSFSSADFGAVNADLVTRTTCYIGQSGDGDNYFNGLMSHVYYIDGTAYAASDFGSTDSTTGQWKINTSPSVTMGTTGFTILKDGNTITDQSSNSNNFTLGGGTLTKSEDCPSNIFATLNPLDNPYPGQIATFSNGNTTGAGTETGFLAGASTIGVSSGKYYAEFKLTAGNMSITVMGVITSPVGDLGTQAPHDNTKFYGVRGNGSKYQPGGSGTSSWTGSYTTNDIIGLALDADNNRLYISKNGQYADGSGNYDEAFTGSPAYITLASDQTYHFMGASISTGSGVSLTMQSNFGNGFFGTTAISSEGTNASGIGIFEYDVPTGYTALSTKGLNL